MVESNKVVEGLCTMAEVAESSDGEDPETSSGIGEADQSIGYIICYANVVDLYERKN